MDKQHRIKNLTILLLSVGVIISVITVFILSRKLTIAERGVNQMKLEQANLNRIDQVYRLADSLGSIPEAQAVTNAGRFREAHPGYGVYYDSSEISYYATEVFPKLVKAQMDYMKAHGKPYDPNVYKWKIGFYWVLNKGNSNDVKFDFCLVPLLINEKDPAQCFDYFNDEESRYDHLPTIRIRKREALKALEDSSSTGNVFNTGTMFP